MARFWQVPVVAAAGLVAAAIAGCGSSSQTIHGTLMPPGYQPTYSECAMTNPQPGDQVVVIDPSGKVIATATLGTWQHDHATYQGITDYGCHMPFTMTGVPSEPRYGFQVQGVPGTSWVTNATDVSLTVSQS